MASKYEGGSRSPVPPEKMGAIRESSNGDAVMIEGEESDTVKEQLIVGLLKRVYTISDMIKECEKFSQYDLSEKMRNELNEAVKSLQSLAQYLERGAEPTKVVINLIDFAPVRRRLRELFVPDEASMSVVLGPPSTKKKESTRDGLYSDAEDTEPGRRQSEATSVSRGPVYSSIPPDEEGTAIVSPLPKPAPSSHDVVTGTYPAVKPKRWWQVWKK